MIYVMERRADVVTGHEHTQLVAIRALAPEIDFTVVTSLNGRDADAIDILSPRRQVRQQPQKSLTRDVDAMTRFIADRQDDTCVFLLPTADAYDIRLALRLCERIQRPIRFALRVLLPNQDGIGGLDAAERTALEGAIGAGKISLHTETFELKEYMATSHGLVAQDDLLLPCSIDPTNPPPQKSQSPSAPFVVGYLGLPRKEKGAKMVPKIISALGERLTSADRPIRFTLQMPKRPRLNLQSLLYVRDCNKAAHRGQSVSIDWIGKSPQGAAFTDLVAQQDLLLLPYQVEAYAHRGSGFVIDGVLAGVRILHAQGMGMKHFLQHTGVAAEEVDEFVDQIIALSTAPALSPSAIAAGREAIATQLNRTRAMLLAL